MSSLLYFSLSGRVGNWEGGVGDCGEGGVAEGDAGMLNGNDTKGWQDCPALTVTIGLVQLQWKDVSVICLLWWLV